MLSLRGVVEIGIGEYEDAPWPVAPAGDYRWEVLDAGTDAAVIGTVLAAAADWCRPEDTADDLAPTPTEALRWVAEADYLVISAGIQAADGTAEVNPGCCCELNDWHGWGDPERRSEMWLGHSPEPWIEPSENGLTIHQDKDEPARASVFIRAEELPRLLAELQADLTGFLGAVERWATEVTGDAQLAAAVAGNIDRRVGIRGPIDAPQ